MAVRGRNDATLRAFEDRDNPATSVEFKKTRRDLSKRLIAGDARERNGKHNPYFTSLVDRYQVTPDLNFHYFTGHTRNLMPIKEMKQFNKELQDTDYQWGNDQAITRSKSRGTMEPVY